jgi:hypothetical protein
MWYNARLLGQEIIWNILGSAMYPVSFFHRVGGQMKTNVRPQLFQSKFPTAE